MKKTAIFALIAGAGLFVIACGNDKTELTFTNSTASSGKINDIVWSNEQAWNSATGYEKGAATEAKDVSATTGTITAVSYLSGTSYVAGTATDESGTQKTFVLNSGGSNVLTIKVQ